MDFTVEIGAELKKGALADIRQQLDNLTKEYNIQADVDVKVNKANVTKQLKPIEKDIKNLNKINVNLDDSLVSDIARLNTSFDRLNDSIDEIKVSLGSIDKGSGMSSMLESINKISDAFSKVTSEVKALTNVLDGTNFNLNLGLNLGGSNNPIANNIAYGNKARSETLPQLKQQVSDLVNYYNKTYGVSLNEFEALAKLAGGTKLGNGDFFANLFDMPNRMNGKSLSGQMDAYREFISLFQQAAKLKGLDLTSVTSGWSQSADKMIEDAQKIQTGEKQMEESFVKMREIFGGGSNFNLDGVSVQLDTVISKLEEMVSVIRQLSSGIQIDGLSVALDNANSSAEELVNNCKNIQTSLNSATANVNSKTASVGQLNDFARKLETIDLSATETQINNIKGAMRSFGFNDSAIESATQDLEKMGLTVEKISTTIKDDGSLTLSVKGIDELGRAVTAIKKVEFDGDDFKIEPISTAFVNSLGKVETETERIKAKFKELIDTEKNIGKTKIELEGLDDSSADAARCEAKLEELQNTANELRTALGGVSKDSQGNLSLSQWERWNSILKESADNLQKVKNKNIDAQTLTAKKHFDDFNSGRLTSEIASLEKQMDNIVHLSSSTATAINNAKQAMEEFKVIASKYNQDGIVENANEAIGAYERMADAIDKAKNAIRDNKIQSDSLVANDKLKYRQDNLIAQIRTWKVENSAAMKKYGAELDALIAKIRKCDASQLDGLKSEFTEIKTRAKEAGLATMNMSDRLKMQFNRLGAYFAASMSIMEVIQGLRQMAQAVLEVDTALTGLYRVTDLTNSQYDELYDKMINSAKEYGTTLKDMIDATSDWVRAGFDADTSVGLSEITSMYQHISDLDYDTAAENLITSYNGFKQALLDTYGGDEVAAVGHIADVLNELDNEFAVTAAGLGEGLTRSASALDIAGNTFEESAAMIGAVTEVTQDPEKAGSAMKILSLRLRGMKGQLEEIEAGASEGVESISKMQTQVLNMTGGKVNIFDPNGEFRSTYDIMVDIADVWDDLSSIDQAQLLETIAGKHRANDVAALIQNMDNAIEMNEAAMDSAGSAATENAKYVDSLQGRINKLTTAWQAFANTTMDSDFLKDAVSVATALLDVFDGLIDNAGLLPTLFGAVAAGLSFKNFGFFTKIEEEANISGKKISNIFTNTFKAFKSAENFSLPSEDILDIANDRKLLEQYAEGNADVLNYMTDSTKKFALTNELLSKGFETANPLIEQNAKTMTMASIATEAQNKNLMNCKALINGYNNNVEEMGLSQLEFAQAVGQSNPTLGKYLSTLKKGEGSLWGYISSLIATKAATIGVEVATMAMNAALTMGISFAISALVSWISDLINAEENLAEKINEVTASYKEQHDALIKNKSDFKDLASKYEKLSKGVDELSGKNISLTSDEYQEYLGVVNQIADMAPDLVSGYDSQGNAILNCAGSVEELTDAYNELIIAQNNELLRGNGEDYKGISAISDDLANSFNNLQDTGFWNDKANFTSSNALKDILESSVIDEGTVAKVTKENNANIYNIGKSLAKALEDQNLKLDMETPSTWASEEEWSKFVAAVCRQHPKVAKSIVDNMDEEMDAATEEMRTAINAHMENAFLQGKYYGIDDEMQGIAASIVSSLDSQIINDLNNTGGEDAVLGYVDDILGAINTLNQSSKNLLKRGFNLGTEFQNGELTFGEYQSQLKKVTDLVENMGLDEDVVAQIKLDLNVDEVTEQYDTLKNRLTSDEFSIKMDDSEAEDFLNSLSSSELTAAINLIGSSEVKLNLNDISASELRAKIKEEAAYIDAMNFEISVEAETKGIEAFNTALSESRSATGLTIDSIDALKSRYQWLDGYDAATLFQETANGISLNEEALRKLESEYADSQLSETTKSLDTLKDRYDELGTEIQNCSNEAGKAELVNEREDIRARITELAQYATQLEGLTSAYNEWQNAENAGNERDMYENVHSAMEGIKDELGKGWIDDGTEEYFQLIWGEDNWSGAGKSISDYRKQWNTLDDTIKGTSYSIQDFFKTNEDGELTSEGIFNFFDAVGEKQKELGEDWIQYDDEGNMISFDFGVDGDKAIAEALGVSEELVQIFLRASQDAGFVVNFDGTYTQLANLQNEAMAANDKLKELKLTDITFDFNSNSLADLNEQLEEAKKILENKDFWNADGTFNFEAKGATEAMQIVSTLQATIDNLDNKYIGLTVEDEAFEEPLTKLQDYESKVAQLNQLELNPTANAEDIKTVKASMEEIVDYFHDIDDETKKKIGIEVDATPEEIQKQIETGEIEIPTTLDIQTSMDESLKDLRDLAMLNSGFLSEEQEHEIKVRLGIEVDEEEVKDEVDSATEEASDGKITLGAEVNLETSTIVGGGVDFGILEDTLNSLDDKQIEIVADVIGSIDVEELQSAMNNLDDVEVQAIAKALGTGDVELLKSTINGMDDKKVQAIAEAFGYDDVESLKAAINNMDDKTVQAIAQALGITDVESLNTAIDNMDDKTVQAIADTVGTKDVLGLQDAINELHGKDVYIDVWSRGISVVQSKINSIVAKASGKSPADGTAHANGTAFAEGTTGKAFKKGSWGIKGSGTALVGELGQELVVRDGRFFTVGDNGAEFFNYKPNDIIFNAGQTRQLFEQGKIVNGKTRGRAVVSGTAFAEGKAFSRGTAGDNPWDDSPSSSPSSKSSSSSSKSKSSKSSSSKEADEFLEKMDWIEIAIDRIERAISRLDLKASSVYRNWSVRNSSLVSEMGKVREEINLQERAYNRYIQEANSVGLSSSWAKKVREGKVDIESITDEDLKEKIDEYQQWYEKALDCSDAIDELNENLSELYQQQFDNVVTEFEGILSIAEHTNNMIEEFMNQSEAQAWLTSTEYYDALIDYEEDKQKTLLKQRDEMYAALNDAVASGTIKEGSEAWTEMITQINETTLAIEESTTAILEYGQSIQELEWEQFDILQNKISRITDETEFLVNLLSSDELYDDKGQLTNSGMSTMGLHGVDYNVHMAQADQAGAEATRLKAQLQEDPFDQDLLDRYHEMIDLQREHIEAAQDSKEAIRDMVEEGIELELEALQELIDKRNEALDSQKDAYDYQKKVKEQIEEIAALEKQMAAYAGDTSEETRAKVQELKVSLEEARTDLEETEYDKYISDQEKLLDELYLEYETILNERLDNLELLVTEMVALINEESNLINETLMTKVDSVGTELSTAMGTIWNTSDFTNIQDKITDGAGVVKDVITMYGDKFSAAQTTTNDALKNISTDVASMIGQLNKLAKTNVKTAEQSNAAKSKASSGKGNSGNKNNNNANNNNNKNNTGKTSTGDGTPKVGDKVKFVSGKYYYDSQGTSPLGSKYQGKEVYITNINKKGSHPYHISTGKKLGSGDLGWLKLNQLSGYATGKRNFLSDEVAWTQENGSEMIIRPSDGAILTPLAKNDSVLNAVASKNLWNMANSPTEFIKDSLGVGDVNAPLGSGGQTNVEQNFENISFIMPNVKNYEEMLTQLKKDKRFQSLIDSMGIDQMAGKSAIRKGKSIR